VLEIKILFFSNVQKQMEALTADLASLSTEKKNSMSLLDVVGADIMGSFDRNM
jgi:hypothetical protein